MNDRFDIVAAFVDGEPIAAADLASALADEDARAYLVDVLALRGLVSDAKPQLVTTPFHVAGKRHGNLFRFAAAALIVAGVTGAFVVGKLRGEREARIELAAASTTPVPASTTVAPAPTHVYRMENGVNWNERAGGN